jgi:hypothetical protein
VPFNAYGFIYGFLPVTALLFFGLAAPAAAQFAAVDRLLADLPRRSGVARPAP